MFPHMCSRRVEKEVQRRVQWKVFLTFIKQNIAAAQKQNRILKAAAQALLVSPRDDSSPADVSVDGPRLRLNVSFWIDCWCGCSLDLFFSTHAWKSDFFLLESPLICPENLIWRPQPCSCTTHSASFSNVSPCRGPGNEVCAIIECQKDEPVSTKWK